MALFGRSEKEKTPAASQTRPVVARKAFCIVCESHQQFSRCWMRVNYVTQCPCCGFAIEDPALIYHKFQPSCPMCGEFLEQPNFEYGTCDICGSKYEIMAGTKPGLLPNKAQRAEMNKHGRVWRYE